MPKVGFGALMRQSVPRYAASSRGKTLLDLAGAMVENQHDQHTRAQRLTDAVDLVRITEVVQVPRNGAEEFFPQPRRGQAAKSREKDVSLVSTAIAKKLECRSTVPLNTE